MRYRFTFVVLGLLLSFGLPRLLRGPVYSGWTTDASGRLLFNIDERDLKAPQWRRPEGITSAVNLPAMVITVPLEFAIWRGRLPFEYRVPWLVWSAIIAGIPVWWLTGKVVEQTVAIFRRQPFDGPTKLDWFYVVTCTLVGGICTSAWFSGPTDLPDLLEFAVGGTLWLLIGLAALAVRILQFRGIRKAAPYTTASATGSVE